MLELKSKDKLNQPCFVLELVTCEFLKPLSVFGSLSCNTTRARMTYKIVLTT